MPVCANCGRQAVRRPRNVIQKLTDRAVYQCEACKRRMHVRRSLFRIFGPHTECPKCGTTNLSRLKSRDRLDAMQRNPLRHFLRLVGAPLFHCTYCRLQFRDWRKLKSAHLQ